MAIKNRVTGEKTYMGMIISERGTFRMDTLMDEVVVWNGEKQCPETIYLGQCDEHVERGQDLSPENLEQYSQWEKKQYQKLLLKAADKLARTLVVGSTVKVVHGRNVPINTVGVVVSIFKASNFTQLRIVTAGGIEYKTYTRNVDMLVNGEFTDEFNA